MTFPVNCRAAVAAALFAIGFPVAGAVPAKGGSSTPDFAFPAEEAARAAAGLQASLDAGRSVDALEAAVRLSIARSLIDRAGIGAEMNLLDSVARCLPQPWCGVGLLLEATGFNQVYNSQPWVFNGRTLPLQPLPADPLEWSGAQFSAGVKRLVGEACSGLDSGFSLPIEQLGSLVNDLGDARTAGMTVADFMAMRSVYLLTSFYGGSDDAVPLLPFASAAERSPAKAKASDVTAVDIADRMIAWHESHGTTEALVAWVSRKSDLLPYEQRAGFIESWLKRLDSEAACVPLVASLADMRFPAAANGLLSDSDLEAYHQFYDYVTALKKRFGTVPALDNVLARMSQCLVSIDMRTQYLPGSPVSGTVKVANGKATWLLLYNVPENLSDDRDVNRLIQGRRPIASVQVSEGVAVPGVVKHDFAFDAQSPGHYVVIASTKQSAGGIPDEVRRNGWTQPFSVSSLVATAVTVQGKDGPVTRLYVADGHGQKPIEGAEVTLNTRKGNSWARQSVLTTDRDGRVDIPKGEWRAVVRKGNDMTVTDIYTFSRNNDRSERTYATVLSDLAIYHPGDTVGFGVLAYTVNGNRIALASGRTGRVRLLDANWQEAASTDITIGTDGRASGRLAIPRGGLLGRFNVQVLIDEREVGSTSVQVADYRQPTFFVTLEQPVLTAGDSIATIKGQAMTYSGMPLPGTSVDYEVRWRPWWRWPSPTGSARYGGTLTAGADGCFELRLPLEALRDTPYVRGIFEVTAVSTAPSGETAEAIPVRFSLGKGLVIVADVSEVTTVRGDEVRWPIRLTDMLDRTVEGEVSYTLTDKTDNRVVAEGVSKTPVLSLRAASVPSGRYTLKLEAKGDSAATSEFTTVVWRESDRNMPYATPMWTPSTEVTADKGERKVGLRAGSAYKGDMLLCVVSASDGSESVRWIPSDGILGTVEVDAPVDGMRRWVYLSGVHDLEASTARVTVLPPSAADRMTVETLTWRDHVVPGDTERVRFRFTSPSGLTEGVFAVMTDKALEALAPFSWSSSPRNMLSYLDPVSVNLRNRTTNFDVQYTLDRIKWQTVSSPSWPVWNFYGYGLYGSQSVMIRGTRNMKLMANAAMTGGVMQDAVTEAAVTEENAVYMSAASDLGAMKAEAEDIDEVPAESGMGNGTSERDNTPLRGLEHPLAFFRPDLKPSSDGTLEIEFEVPDFNTTWQLQLLGYDSSLYTATLKAEAVAARPVMASVNAPRFVRTGDKVETVATLYNNTDSTAMVSGRMVWLDAVSGRVVAERQFEAAPVDAYGSRLVALPLEVCDNTQALTLQVYATAGRHTDGEQALVPVYPATSMVTHSEGFYLQPEQTQWSGTLPKASANTTLTLQYCDNPVWLCVAALPDIMTPSNSTLTAKVDALYANTLSAGLAARYPRVREAIELWQRDGAPQSPLAGNASLKTVALEATPWVRNAESEILRMSRLSTLLDTAANTASRRELLASIASLQNADGGWSWCPQMPSSAYMTRRALDRLAYLVAGGYLSQAEVGDMVTKAVTYCDNQAVDEARRVGKNYDPSVLLPYLYTRQSLGRIAGKGSTQWQTLENRGLKAVASSWKNFGIFDKATAAIVLWRSGDHKLPPMILESLRQYATVSDEKGACFANLSSGLDGQTPLLVTARALEAYGVVAPSDAMTNRLRQWLVLSRQALDWGRMQSTAAVTAALLGTGTDWTASATPAEITVNGNPVNVAPYERLTGDVTIPLDARKDGGRKVSIRRDASGPAWGGVLTSSLQPMDDVRAEAGEGLSVGKAVYRLEQGQQGVAAQTTSSGISDLDVKVGDRVRVTLTLNCDRDMDYVALTDQLPACMQLANQLSGYESNDGLWAYRESQAAQVSLFFTFLPKGTHVVTYDCYVTRAGTYSIGIATAQSQYAPVLSAHSGGGTVVSR